MQIINMSYDGRVRRHRSKSGFSLIELLTVMTIIAVLSFSVPLIQSEVSAGTFKSSASQMNELLQGAYAAAIARKTYVWVGFLQLPNSGGVAMAFVYSLSGNPTDINTPANVAPLCRPWILKNLTLTTISQAQINNTARIPSAEVGELFNSGNVLDVANTTPATATGFSTQIAGSTQTIQSGGSSPFTTVMEITPSGQVSVSSNSRYAWIEIGLQPLRGGPNDVAVLQMNSFTGRVVQFSP